MSEAMRLVQTIPVDLAIVDVSLRDGDGLELIRHMRSLDNSIQALVLSMYDETVFAEVALEAGAKGYLSKEESPQKAIEALRRIRDGKFAVSDGVMETIFNRRDRKPRRIEHLLSPRELEVLDKMGDGMGTVEIARALHISKKTVETHKERMKDKMGLESANQLMVLAVRRKFELGGYRPDAWRESGGGAGGAGLEAPSSPGCSPAEGGADDPPEPPAGSGAKRPPQPKPQKGGSNRRKGA